MPEPHSHHGADTIAYGASGRVPGQEYDAVAPDTTLTAGDTFGPVYSLDAAGSGPLEGWTDDLIGPDGHVVTATFTVQYDAGHTGWLSCIAHVGVMKVEFGIDLTSTLPTRRTSVSLIGGLRAETNDTQIYLEVYSYSTDDVIVSTTVAFQELLQYAA